jgi:O-antigen biosynthesis protein
MNLLLQRLTQLGYDAFGAMVPPLGSPTLPGVRYIRYPRLAKFRRFGRRTIAVYPEIVAGNPLRADFVLRYLLNKPGYLVPGTELSFGPDDLYLAFDPSFVPPGRLAFDLFWPLVDRTVYYPPPSGTERNGYAIFTHRKRPDVADLPSWLAPHLVLSMDAARSHDELAKIYRRSIAMVTYERSSAIYEALCCGCPVICIPDETFKESTYQRRFKGAGMIWGWRPEQLERAAVEIENFKADYLDLERSIDGRIIAAFDAAIAQCSER